MAWTAPRTWVAGETVTAAIMNTHVRDNLKEIGDAWDSFTPTWLNGSGGAAIAIGNGSLTGQIVQAGKWIQGTILLTRGSTTNLGSTFHVFGFPVTARTHRQSGVATVFDSSATVATNYQMHQWHGINTTEMVVNAVGGRRIDNSGFGTGPTGWATGDEVFISFRYEAA